MVFFFFFCPLFCEKLPLMWILELPQEQVKAKLRVLLLNMQSQTWFQVISYYRVHAVLVTDARWNWRCMLSFKGCPKANTSLIPCSLISGWLRTALKCYNISLFSYSSDEEFQHTHSQTLYWVNFRDLSVLISAVLSDESPCQMTSI